MSKHHDLRQTKAKFKVVGQLSRTEDDKFYTEGVSKTNRPYRRMNLCVHANKNTTVGNMELFGTEVDNVYYG